MAHHSSQTAAAMDEELHMEWGNSREETMFCCLAQGVQPPFNHGGLGIRNLVDLNKAAMLKYAWSLLHSNNLWSSFFKARFMICFGLSQASYRSSSIWPGIKSALLTIKMVGQWVVGDGQSILIWKDNWGPPLSNLPESNEPNNSSQCLNSWICNGSWNIPSWFQLQYPTITEEIRNITLPLLQKEDVLIWPDATKGHLTFKDAYQFFNDRPATPIFQNVWKVFIPPRVSSLLWRALHNAIPSQINLQKKGIVTASRCSLCCSNVEFTTHVLIQCPFAISVWKWYFEVFNIHSFPISSISELWCFISIKKLSPQISNILMVGAALVFHKLWECRNNSIFNSCKAKLEPLKHHIISCVAELQSMIPGHWYNTNQDKKVLNTFQIAAKYRSSPKIITVLWTFPPPGWIKINTDGMAWQQAALNLLL